MTLLRNRALGALGLLALAMGATACPGQPVPTLTWLPSHTGSPATQGGPPVAIPVGTTSTWYAEVTAPAGAATPTLTISPRTGPAGNVLGAPQVFPMTAGFTGGQLSDHVATYGNWSPAGGSVQFLHESNGVWSPAGTHALAGDERPVGLTDDTLVVMAGGPSVAASLKVYDLTVASGTVTSTLNSTLTIPSGWGAGYVQGFERAAVEGDVIAALGRDTGTGGPGRVAVFRRSTTWHLETTLTYPGLAQAWVDIDDQGATERIALGLLGTSSEVDVYVSSEVDPGAEPVTPVWDWSLESTIQPPAGVADLDAGLNFGYRVSIDGDLMVVSYARRSFGPASPGGADRTVDRAMVFHRAGAAWTLEATLEPLPNPGDQDGRRRLIDVAIAGTHVVGSVLVEGAGGSATRFEAWRFDRAFI